MLQVEINGKEVSVPQGSTIMDAANVAGTYIPHFCYHKKLSIAANCRMCLVDVEKAPKAQPACATPVADGMKVHTNSEMARQAQKDVMGFLLINHPLDCPVCDQGGECQLQDLAVGYGSDKSLFTEPKRAVNVKDIGALVSMQEMSRCIHCTRCVRFTEEIAGLQEIGMISRGDRSEIVSFVNKVVETELSGNVIDLCPVGALTSKPFRYSARSWELSRRKSISAHDALGSNLIMQTKDHQVKRVLPLANEEINECWLSDKDRFAYEGLNSADRLQVPMIKQDGRWHKVNWETALDYVAKGLNGVSNDHGKDAIACFVNPNNTLEEIYLTHKLADQFGVKHVSSQLRRQDMSLLNKGVNWLGQSVNDLLENNVVFVVGSSLRTEQPLLTARIRGAAKNKGLKLNVLNTVQESLQMPVALQAVEHPLSWLSYLNHVLEAVTALKFGQNLAETDVVKLAKSLLENGKTSVVLGALAQNHPHFAQIIAVATKIAEQTHSILGFLPQAANSVGAEAVATSFNKNQTAKQIFAEEKKAYLLVNVEPQNDFANNAQALNAIKKAETVIAFTSFEDKTLLDVADVLLPIAPFTETAGSFVNMEGRLQSFYGVVRPLVETRPLWKVLRVLGNTLNLTGFEQNSIEDVRAEVASAVSLDQSLSNEFLPITTEKSDNDKPILFRVGDIGLYETDAIVRRASSLQKTTQAQTPKAYLHTNTLNQLGLTEGDKVLVTQDATIELVVESNNRLAENVVSLVHHTHTNTLGCLLGEIKLSRG